MMIKIKCKKYEHPVICLYKKKGISTITITITIAITIQMLHVIHNLDQHSFKQLIQLGLVIFLNLQMKVCFIIVGLYTLSCIK
jgi:hypothetical protein